MFLVGFQIHRPTLNQFKYSFSTCAINKFTVKTLLRSCMTTSINSFYPSGYKWHKSLWNSIKFPTSIAITEAYMSLLMLYRYSQNQFDCCHGSNGIATICCCTATFYSYSWWRYFPRSNVGGITDMIVVVGRGPSRTFTTNARIMLTFSTNHWKRLDEWQNYVYLYLSIDRRKLLFEDSYILNKLI